MSTSRTNWSVGALTNEKLLVLRTLADMHDGNCERGKSSARDEPQALSTKDRKRVVRRALAKGARRAQLEISGTLSRGISCPLGHILLEDIRTFSLRSIDPARRTRAREALAPESHRILVEKGGEKERRSRSHDAVTATWENLGNEMDVGRFKFAFLSTADADAAIRAHDAERKKASNGGTRCSNALSLSLSLSLSPALSLKHTRNTTLRRTLASPRAPLSCLVHHPSAP